MKSRGGKNQRGEEKKRQGSKKRKSQKKEDAGAQKGRKVATQCVFSNDFVAPEGRKVGSLKRRVQQHLVRCEMKNCTLLWREAHRSQNVQNTWALFEVEMSKKCAVVARSTFRSQNVQSAPRSEHSWKLRCRKSARRCGAKRVSESKCLKKTPCSDHFWRFRCDFAWQAQGILHLSETWGFCHSFTSVGRRGTFEEDLQRCIFRGRRSARDIFIGGVRRWGRWFPERGCVLEHPIFRFAKMILPDRCSTSYDLASLFRGRRNTLDRWSAKIAKRIGTRPSALHSTFHFWRKPRRIASFLMLSTWKIEEVSRNCFAFDIVRFQNWGSLAK